MFTDNAYENDPQDTTRITVNRLEEYVKEKSTINLWFQNVFVVSLCYIVILYDTFAISSFL